MEDEKKRLAQLAEDERKKQIKLEKKRQEKLKLVGNCSAGYAWIHEGGGHYRCAAGGHTYHFQPGE